MVKLITIHGVGRQERDYAGPLFANLRRLGRQFDAVPLLWDDLDISKRWWIPLPAEVMLDLWLSVSWVFRARRRRILSRIQNAVGDGKNVIVVSHSHGVWFALQALRDGPRIPLLVTMGRDSHRLGGRLFPGHHAVQCTTWLNIHSSLDPLSGEIPAEHLEGAGVGSVRNIKLPLLHTRYWSSTLVASAISLFFPAEEV